MSKIKENDFDITKELMSSANNESQSIHIVSEVLDPATADFEGQGEIVFNIRKAGVINKSSAGHLTVQGSSDNMRLTVGGGVFAMIQRAQLRTSKGVVIASNDNFCDLAAYRNRFVEMGVREKRGVILNGTYECYETVDEPNANSAALLQTTLRLKGEYSSNNGDIPIEYRLGQNSIEYQITLEQLFPESVYYQIPVFLIDGNLQLVLTCTDQVKRGTTSDGTVGNIPGIGADTINITKAQYVSDHLFFDSKTMQQLRAKSETSGIPIPYNDFYTNDLTLTSPNTGITADNNEQKEFRKFIGLSNLDLKYLIMQQQPDPTTDAGFQRNMLNGEYSSRGSWYGGTNTDKKGGVELNVIINNQQYYPIDIQKDSRFYTELELVHKRPLCVPRTTYSASGQVVDQRLKADSTGQNTALNLPSSNNLLSTNTYFNVSQVENLTAANQYLGVNFATVPGAVLNSGKKVGMTPVELKYIRQFVQKNDEDILLRVFACVGRIMVIRGGEVAVSYS